MGMNEELEKAIEAYDASNYPTTIDELISLAREGDAEAQTNLAMRYALGKNVTRDCSLAYIWASFAADQKNKDALELRSKVKIFLNYKKLIEAQYKLGLMYAEGKEIKRDYKLAYVWFGIVCIRKKINHEEYKKEKEICEKMKKHMTSAQVTEAQEMVQNYLGIQKKK